VRLEDDDGWVRANVTDDGNGVPPEIESRLFTRYVHEGPIAFTAGSLGLGTWVSRELARAMGGDVVYERTGNSTCFGLSLPVAAASEAMSDGDALSGVET
jgi:signal transduction histidine kinase